MPAQKTKNWKKNGSTRNQSANFKVNFRPYHAANVPKACDLQELQDEHKPKTTAMLRNIPNRFTQATLMQEIDAAGFEGEYDFFYLPMDIQNRTNVGYCFINFTSCAGLQKFMSVFVGYAFQKHSGQKIAQVSEAHVQGFVENISHFSNRAVAHSRNGQYRPIVIHQGTHMDIARAYELLCLVQGEGQQPSGQVARPGPHANNTIKKPLPPGPTCCQTGIFSPGAVVGHNSHGKT